MMTNPRRISAVLGTAVAPTLTLLGTLLIIPSATAQSPVDRAVKTFNAAANDSGKVKAFCTMLADMDKLAGKAGGNEAAMNAIVAKLPADLKSAVEAEFELPTRDRGNENHPYYKAMDRIASKCGK